MYESCTRSPIYKYITLITISGHLFTLQWDRLNDPKIWKDAATQMFFTLGMGFGTLITFSSYMPKNNQCVRDTYTVVFINCGTSIFSGFVIFAILGYRELKTGIKAADVSFIKNDAILFWQWFWEEIMSDIF